MASERRVEYAVPRPDGGSVVVTVRFAPDGDRFDVDRNAPRDHDARETGGGHLVALCLVSLIVVAVATSFAAHTRRETEAGLSTRSAQLDLRTRNLSGARPNEADSQAMAAYRTESGEVRQIQDDLVWIAGHKVTPAPISRLVWTPTQITVTGPYPTSPFRIADRTVVRTARPQGPGIYEYVVTSPLPRPSPGPIPVAVAGLSAPGAPGGR